MDVFDKFYEIFVSPIGLIILACSIWVLIDAKRIGVRKGLIPGFFDVGPFAWFCFCILLFVVGFPAYLVKRGHYIRALERRDEPRPESAGEEQRGKNTRPCPFCAEPIRIEAVKCRHCGEMVAATARPSQISALGIAAIVLGIGGITMPYFAAVFLVPAGLTCAVLAYRSGRRGMGIAGIALGVLGIGSIVYTSNKLTEIVRDPFGAKTPWADDAPPIVSKAEYDLIEDGMSYDQVVAIIGSPGEQISRSELGGFITVMYSWHNKNGSNMNAMFQNDRLISKAQFGLR